MAGIKISALPPVAPPLVTDLLAVVQSGVTTRQTIQSLLDLFNGLIQLASPAQVTGLAALLAGYLPLAGGTMIGNLILNGNPTSANQAANKAYVDAIGGGFTVVLQCAAATTVNLTATYANGISGVGSTLTNSGAMAAFVVDGYAAIVNDRILVKDQTNTFENGIYTVTDVGSGATNWILTRAADYDEAPLEIFPGTLVLIVNGTVNANTSWLETATVTTIGTDPILFALFSASPSDFFLVANNLSEGIPATMRTNLGLGTAAVKDATDVAQPFVASVLGATTPGNFATFVDANGTIEDGGGGAGFLQIANNLSDVASIPASNLNLFVTNTIVGNTALTPADFGRLTIVAGGGSAIVTLPAHSAGDYLEFSIQVTGGSNVILSPTSGTIDGFATKQYLQYDYVKLYDDGVNYFTLSEKLFPMQVQSVVLSGAAVPLVTMVDTNVTSISVPPSVWDVTGHTGFDVPVTGATTEYGWISLTSATLPDFALRGALTTNLNNLNSNSFCVPQMRFTLTTTTTIYLSVRSTFAPGPNSAFGGIYAKRVT